MTQLPVYVPNQEEQKDPEKYSKNVRKYMVRLAPTSLQPLPHAAHRVDAEPACAFLSLTCTRVQRLDTVHDCAWAACIC